MFKKKLILESVQYAREIKLIEDLIIKIKEKTKLNFIDDNVKIKKDDELNMWYSPTQKKIRVSTGALQDIKNGKIDNNETKIILYHEFGHASGSPPVIKLKHIIILLMVTIIPTIIFFVLLPKLSFFLPIILFFIIVYSIVFLISSYRREWEKQADDFALKYIEPEKLKSLIQKTHQKRTLLGSISKLKPFYYFRLSPSLEERIKNIESYKEKL